MRAENCSFGRVKLYFAATANEQLVPFGAFEREARKRGAYGSRIRRFLPFFFAFDLFFHKITLLLRISPELRAYLFL
jgi:hypothetical protein